MRTATVNIPADAIGMAGENRPIATNKIRNEMNGRVVQVENEYEYKGECLVDWDKYDYVTPITDSDVYSWHKSWLADMQNDTPIKHQKIWSVWVDGFEMNSYILDYAQASDMKESLALEDEYLGSEIIIDDTYNLERSNIKYLLESALTRYKNRKDEVQAELDDMEYEPAPSGELNESMIPMDLAETELDILGDVISDLETMLQEGIFK